MLGDFKDITVEFHSINTRFYRQGKDFMVATTGKFSWFFTDPQSVLDIEAAVCRKQKLI